MGRGAAVAIAVLCGLAAAGLYLTAVLGSTGALILVYLTQLPLFIAGLWLGAGAAALAGLTATAVMLGASDALGAGIFAALNAVPVVLLVRQALLARRRPDGAVDWYPSGLLTGWLTALALAGLAAAVLLLGGRQGVEAQLNPMLGRLLAELGDPNPADRDALAHLLVMVMPGVAAASWMAMVAANGILAQGVLARFGVAWRPSPDLAALTLPAWMLPVLAAASLATAVGGTARFFGVNALIVLGVPFCLAGLAVVHTVARRLPHPMAALIPIYAMAALFGWPLMVIAIVGLFECGFRLRRRLAGNGSVGGNFDG